MNRTVIAAAALALAACSPEFDPASRIEKLRVLAVRAEPPELAPAADPSAAHTAALTSLVVRADFDADPLRSTTVVYAACIPAPGVPAPTPCERLAALRDPTALIAAAAQGACSAGMDPEAPGTIFLAGVEACAAGTCAPAVAGAPLPTPELELPPELAFTALPAGSPDRILGVQAVVLAFALDATPDELVEGAGSSCRMGTVAARLAALWGSREHVLSVKRVAIRGPESPNAPNANPAVKGILAGAVPLLDPASVSTVAPGTIDLRPILPDDVDTLRATYDELDASGAVIERVREDWVYSWFATAGELDELHTRELVPDPWTVGERATPVLAAVVVRDLRGGTAWALRTVRVAR